MTEPLSEAFAGISPQTFKGLVYRSVKTGLDALSMQGSISMGGRWNPKGEFGAIYTSLSKETVKSEIKRSAKRKGVSSSELAPRDIVHIRVSLKKVLSLTDAKILEKVGLTKNDLIEKSWGLTQKVARVAHGLGFEAILCPSAAGKGTNLVVFLDNIPQDSYPEEVNREEFSFTRPASLSTNEKP